jgi:mannitol-1-phosphate 5-dehydrogenase
MGQLWYDAGLSTGFVDVAPELVAALNERGQYPLRLVDSATTQDLSIGQVQAVLTPETATIVTWLSHCQLACTAVGVNAFQSLAPLVAQGVVQRAQTGIPLSILCCENQKDAGAMLRSAVQAYLPESDVLNTYFESSVGFVDASVGRMVPPPTPELLAEDPLLILAEPYNTLPIDAQTLRGTLPPIPGLLPKTPFAGYVVRKLFTHNGAHALLAYEGFLHGKTEIADCLQVPEIRTHLLAFWHETGNALVAEFGFPPDEQREHETDLLRRLANRALRDTVQRVGRDPVRKLRADDRLVGAALLCQKHGFDCTPAVRAIASALRFTPSHDPTSAQVQNLVAQQGVSGAFVNLSGLSADNPLVTRVESAYNELR